MKYAVTAATGHFGQAALQALTQLLPASDIVALARNTEKASQMVPAGVTVAPGDYGNVEQLTASLAGVDRLLFVSSQPSNDLPRAKQHQNMVQAAIAAGVKRIAYTSFPDTDHANSFLADDHKLTEGWIKDSGIAYSFLRNNWYLQNEMATIQGALQTGQFPYSAGTGKAGWTREENYAKGDARVLTLDDPKAVYEFGGPIIDYPTLAQALSQVSGKQIQPVALSDADYRAALLKAGLDEQTAGFVVGVQGLIRDGELEVASNDLNDVLGGKLESLTDGLKAILK